MMVRDRRLDRGRGGLWPRADRDSRKNARTGWADERRAKAGEGVHPQRRDSCFEYLGSSIMRSRSISVMLVDDHAVVREGYRRLLEKHEGITVVAEAADAASAYQAYKNKSPDVVVMDVSLPGRGGIDAIRQIRQLDPAARLLVFTMHLSPTFALQAFRAGAKGFVTKSSPPELLVSAVCDVAAGRVAICPEISEALAISRLEGCGTGIDN